MENDHADHVYANAPYYCPPFLINTCSFVIIVAILIAKTVW